MTDFAATRRLFHIPDSIVHLDGNSLGPLPIAARLRIMSVLDGEGAHCSSPAGKAGWMVEPRRIGDRVARLIGAADATVTMAAPLPSSSSRRSRTRDYHQMQRFARKL
jgi:kynureninase